MEGRRYRIESGGVSLFARAWGDPDATPLVLVHGYPDNHGLWEPVAEQLAGRFHVIAYDVRCAGASDKPRRVSAYRMDKLADDLRAVTEALIPGRDFHLAGHDWGSIQSWESVTTEPLKSRILSFTSISGPCLDHVGFWMRRRLGSLSWREQRKALRQLVSSWYIMLFQLPVLPPLAWQLGVGRLWPVMLEKVEGIADATAAEDAETRTTDGRYGVNLYRANFMQKLLSPKERHAAAPVQLIVPLRDNYASPALFEELHQWVPQLYRVDIDAGHWVIMSDPADIAARIGGFVDAVEARNLEERFSDARVGHTA